MKEKLIDLHRFLIEIKDDIRLEYKHDCERHIKFIETLLSKNEFKISKADATCIAAIIAYVIKYFIDSP
jgi:predicted nucleic-acid-binding protein